MAAAAFSYNKTICSRIRNHLLPKHFHKSWKQRFFSHTSVNKKYILLSVSPESIRKGVTWLFTLVTNVRNIPALKKKMLIIYLSICAIFYMFSITYFSPFLVSLMHLGTCFLSFNLESPIRLKQETPTIIYQLTLITENHNVAVFQRESISMDATRGSNFN